MSKALFLAIGCMVPLLMQAQQLAPQQTRYRADQILVKPRGGVEEMGLLHAFIQGQTRKRFSGFGNLEVVAIPTGAAVEDVIEAYRESGFSGIC